MRFCLVIVSLFCVPWEGATQNPSRELLREGRTFVTPDGRSFVAQPGEEADGKIELFDPHAGYWARYHLEQLEHLDDSARSVMSENYAVRMLSYDDVGAICAFLPRLE